ncbi:MAG: VacJ family lipoprotein [Gammaproteobacteria bacterium]|nr:VacJ family lipoprotein [Gammaproteobacteria bacterium]
MTMVQYRSAGTIGLLCAIFLALSACTRPPNDTPSKDPFEAINRPIYKFNNGLDKVILKPVAKGYEFITPRFFRTGVSNFFNNLTYPVTIANSFLQGKLLQGLQDTGRFALNSTLGLAGILDPATSVGLNQNNEDFGQTLAVWGVPQGPYIVLPLLGPQTLSSGLGIIANAQVNPVLQWPNSSVRSKLFIAWTIETRQTLLSFDETIQESFDPYLFVRESYLQNRRYQINDGVIPDSDLDDGFSDDDFAEFE